MPLKYRPCPGNSGGVIFVFKEVCEEEYIQRIKTDTELFATVVMQISITVIDKKPFGPDEIAEPGGVVEVYTHQKVMINGVWYSRKQSSF